MSFSCALGSQVDGFLGACASSTWEKRLSFPANASLSFRQYGQVIRFRGFGPGFALGCLRRCCMNALCKSAMALGNFCLVIQKKLKFRVVKAQGKAKAVKELVEWLWPRALPPASACRKSWQALSRAKAIGNCSTRTPIAEKIRSSVTPSGCGSGCGSGKLQIFTAIWITATALDFGASYLTNNQHFSRVPNSNNQSFKHIIISNTLDVRITHSFAH